MKKRLFTITLSGIALAAVVFLCWASIFLLNLRLPDQGWEFGYYGQFNRVKHVIQDMPHVEIVGNSQHQDISLEDFAFTLLIDGGRQVSVTLSENSPQMKMRDKSRILKFIEEKIEEGSNTSVHPSVHRANAMNTGWPQRSAGGMEMGIRITSEVIAKGRGAVVKHWVRTGFLGFGPLLGLFLINSDDISNHSIWSKAIILAGCTLFAGPAWGFLSGHAYWLLKRGQAEQPAAPLPSEGSPSDGRWA
jgi:hypothetical protein